GSGSPMQVIVAESSLQATADRLLDQDGIDSVTITAEDSPSGSAPVTADGIQAQGPPGTPAPEPTVVDGEVLLQATSPMPRTPPRRSRRCAQCAPTSPRRSWTRWWAG